MSLHVVMVSEPGRNQRSSQRLFPTKALIVSSDQMLPSGPFIEVMKSLAAADVRFIVVGGVAVVLHGHLRLTADLDLVLDMTPDNLRRAVSALADLDFKPRAPVPIETFESPEERKRLRREKQMEVFSLWSASRAGFEVDLFTETPFDYDEVARRATRVIVDGFEILVAPVSVLIAMKRKASRGRDLEDITVLERILRERGESDE